jgi:hypothetical protein
MSEEAECPKCGGLMREGFLVERDSPLSLLTLGEGIYWTPNEEGMIGERISLRSFACPDCGFVEIYIRRLESDRESIMKAPVAKRTR